ncbi:hypothetical protein [Streptosporangium carneum]|uniref:Uncharacterized protein n=1 Tax=Streptosporangium carneum TaxID=47481 RepID=A0A9W6I3M9_9ACTN|nr:hypothetical protein [Streptosporangium carneum]GLK10649.1 hypothetical protein GCM10017600_40550 [Streptosporangium carneum]
MSHTEHDLRELLAARSEGGRGGPARLDEIVARGRRIRRRRGWAAAGTVAAAFAVLAVLVPSLLSGVSGANGRRSDIAARVGETERAPREEGVRLAGARSENTAKVERLSVTPRSDETSYRVNCAEGWAFVRLGDQVDGGVCGAHDTQWTLSGSLDEAREGVPATVEAFTVPASQVPQDVRERSDGTLSSGDFDRMLADSAPREALWEIAIHDGGVSSMSCSPDICLDSGTLPAAHGERNLAGLPNGHQIEGRRLTEINRRVAFAPALHGGARVYVRCEGEELHAFIWAGKGGDDGVLAKSLPCGAKPALWEFSADGPTDVTVAVIRRDRVPDGVDFVSDLRVASDRANLLLRKLTPEAGKWEVSIQQWDEPESKVRVSEGPEGRSYTFGD